MNNKTSIYSILILLIILFVVSCKYPKQLRKYPIYMRKNLYESHEECANRLRKYYTIVENDTFYYHISLYDYIWHVGPYDPP